MSTFTDSPLGTPTNSPSPGRNSRHKRHHSSHSKSPILSRCLRKSPSTSSSSIVSASSPPPPVAANVTHATSKSNNKGNSDQLHQPQLVTSGDGIECSSRGTSATRTTGDAATSSHHHQYTSSKPGGPFTTGKQQFITSSTGGGSCHETSSPSPSSLRIKVTAVRKMASLWSHIKNSSPVKKAKMSSWMSTSGGTGSGSHSPEITRRSSHHSLFSLKGLRSKKDKLRRSGQYSYSHPDVSCGNLASLAFPGSSSRDDMALELIAATSAPANSATVHHPPPASSIVTGGTSGGSAVTSIATATIESSIDTSNQATSQCINSNHHPQSGQVKSVKSHIFSAFSRQTSKEVDAPTVRPLGGGDAEGSPAGPGNDPLQTASSSTGPGCSNYRYEESPLRTSYPFYQLEVHLHYGKDLLAKDTGGTSDPYVKFKIGPKQLYRSRTINKTLNPVWNEHFMALIDDLSQPLILRVFDYDFGFQDDYLGTAIIELANVQWNLAQEYKLTLTETGKIDEEEPWGQIVLGLRLQPKTQEEKEELFGKSARTNTVIASSTDHGHHGLLHHSILGGPASDPSGPGHSSATSIGHISKLKKQKTQTWDSVVNIILMEGKGLSAKDENGLSDPYVKFKLGSEKYKSKVIFKTLNPIWNEQFDLHAFPDQCKTLEVSVYDKDHHGRDDFMGKFTIELDSLAKEETHSLIKELEGGEGTIHLVITVSGTLGSAGVSSNLISYSQSTESINAAHRKYSWFRTLNDIDDVGILTVKVFRAENLAAADFSGKSDPFCVVQLVNSRLQTNTEYKTLSPEWNKIFTFKIKDVHEALDVTVYDEDRDKKVEFLGRVLIPLLRIKNGEKKWYQLKDKKCTIRAKGQILLELTLTYNPLRAAVRTINPREDKYITPDVKFKRSIFVRNVMRVKSLVMEVLDIIKFVNSCFTWESVPRSLCALFVFLTVTYFFETYMVPLVLLLIFAKYFICATLSSHFGSHVQRDDEQVDEPVDPMDDSAIGSMEGDTDDPGEKKTLKERLQTVQEITALVQNVLGEIASFGERVKNTFNFSVPFLSYFAVIVLIAVGAILYIIPLRYLLMAWGLNKFTKKLRNPNAINNNELLDFISRAPDSDEKLMYRELRPMPSTSATETLTKKKQK